MVMQIWQHATAGDHFAANTETRKASGPLHYSEVVGYLQGETQPQDDELFAELENNPAYFLRFNESDVEEAEIYSNP